jgi:hypothetical protein
VLDDGTACAVKPLALPEPVEYPLECLSFMRAAQEAGARSPADLLSVVDVDRRKCAGQRQLLVNGGAEAFGAERSPQRNDRVGDPGRCFV